MNAGIPVGLESRANTNGCTLFFSGREAIQIYNMYILCSGREAI